MRILFLTFFFLGVGLIDVNAINATLWLQIVLGLKAGNGAHGIQIPEGYPCYLANSIGDLGSYCTPTQCRTGDTFHSYYCSINPTRLNTILNILLSVGTCQTGLVCCPSSAVIICPGTTVPSSGIPEEGLCNAGVSADIASWCLKRDCSSNQTVQYCPQNLNLPQGACADDTLACCPAPLALPCNLTLTG